MSFIVDIIEDIVDVIVDVVEAVVDAVVGIVEAVVSGIAELLGFDTEDQIIEQFEVYNQALFDSSIVDSKLSKKAVNSAVVNNISLPDLVIYNAIWGESVAKSLKDFVQYIDDGHYYTGFPTVESHINYVDENEVANVLGTNHGEPCTLISANLGRLPISVWVEYWLQENRNYNPTSHALGDISNVVVNAVANSSNTTVNQVLTDWDIQISDSFNFAEDATADARWFVDLDNITYNTSTDDYTLNLYTGALTRTLANEVPTKPVGSHVYSFYYLDSNPTQTKVFIYKLGTGTYTNLDDIEPNQSISSSVLKTLPAVPLRVNNVNYTGGSHETQINDLLAKLKIDGPGVLQGITSDYGGNMNDLDHIYVNFGVRLWDTTQGGLKYLFSLFDKLHTSATVTEADYTSATGEKPYNNIIVTHDDYKYIFKYAYSTYTHSTLSEVNADVNLSNIYYSNSSKFDDNNILITPYYASSTQLMYKVQYQADNLSEVNAFLAGNGVAAPGSTTTEGQGKLQVTVRISYSGTVQDSDGADSGHTVLKPDLVYQNNGGTLQIVQSVAEETTQSQEIIFYEIVPNGLNSYTVRAPIAGLHVKDTESGVFKLVKFNLANKDDLMLPFFYGAIDNISTHELSSMWLASAHTSVYLAHYEVIEASGGGFFKLLIAIIIIVVIAIATGYVDPSTWGTVTQTTVTSGTATNGTILVTNSFGVVTEQIVVNGAVTSSSIAWSTTLTNAAIGFVENQLISYAIQEVLEDVSPELGFILAVAFQANYGLGKGIDYSSALSGQEMFDTARIVLNSYSGVQSIKLNKDFKATEIERQGNLQRIKDAYTPLEELEESVSFIHELGDNKMHLSNTDVRGYVVPEYPEIFFLETLGTVQMAEQTYNFSYIMEQQYQFNAYRQLM